MQLLQLGERKRLANLGKKVNTNFEICSDTTALSHEFGHGPVIDK